MDLIMAVRTSNILRKEKGYPLENLNGLYQVILETEKGLQLKGEYKKNLDEFLKNG